MRIVMICEFYDERLEFQENLLVKYYRKHGHEVTVITSTFDSVFDYYGDRHDRRAPERRYMDHGATIHKCKYRYNLLNRFRAYRDITPILEEACPQLIFVHDIVPNLREAVRYIKRHPECKMILDYHADYSNSGKNWLSLKVLHGVLRKRILDEARPYLSRIFPVVPASVTFLNEVYGVPLTEMEVLPLGADMDMVRAVRSQSSRQSLRTSLGFRPDDCVIFTGGKLTPNRRTEILFEAVEALRDPTIKVVVVGDAAKGDTTYRDFLHERAARQGGIVFTGWLDKEGVYRYMNAADLAVFPASQSIMWQQAIASGLPLVVGDTGSQDISYLNLAGNIEILRGDEISVDRYAAVIAKIASDRELRERMAKGATEVAREHLDWDRLVWRTLRYNLAGAGEAISS